ncbi:MAG TPA: hypothetical protein VG735_03070 [Caulobacterales bacterium]|nr:hypothetical protein [Caulobacterales bacterium]
MHREEEVRYDSQTGEKIVAEQSVGDRPVIIKKRAGIGTWLGGLVVGALIIAGGFAILVREQGSYSPAGAVVDQKVAKAEEATGKAAEQAGDAAKAAGDKVETATDH